MGKIVFLGTGTSTGVPLIGCKCDVCTSQNPKNKRLRTSLYFEDKGKKVLIDVTPDFRTQALNNNITYLDAVLITHSHADHINGFDDIRQINYLMKWKEIPVFLNLPSSLELQMRFDYIFRDTPQLGGGKPIVRIHVLEDYDEIILDELKIKAFVYFHGKIKVSGFQTDLFTYITDCSFIPLESLKIIKNTKILILGALRYLPHSTHLTISEAINLVKYIKPEITYLTHMGHDIDYDKLYNELKDKNIFPAYDGLTIEI